MGNSKSNVASASPKQVRFKVEDSNSLTKTGASSAITQGCESLQLGLPLRRTARTANIASSRISDAKSM
jgi:hypothetical protein